MMLTETVEHVAKCHQFANEGNRSEFFSILSSKVIVMSNYRALLEKLRPLDYLILFSMIFLGVTTTVAGMFRNPWPFAVGTYVVSILFVLAAIQFKDVQFQRLLVFGLITGIAELITDWYHVVILKSLVYTHLSFFPLLASPEYMPLGWMNVIVQMSYISLRLREEFNLTIPVTMVIIGVLGVLNIPYYEEMAYNAGAWYYTAEWMIGRTPVWVFAAYFVEIPWVVPITMKIEDIARKEDNSWGRQVIIATVVSGLMMGVIIFVGGFITHAALKAPLF